MENVNPRVVIGGNMPPHLEALEAAQDFEVDCAFLIVNSPETAAQAAILIDREVKGRKAAEAQRVKEKEPFLIQSREVDALWKPVTETYVKAIEGVKRQVLEYAAKERALKLLEAEAAREEAQRLEEIAIAKLQENGKAEEAVKIADDAAILAKAKEENANVNRIEADGIRARGIKTVWEAEITDKRALVIALADNAEVQAAAAKVANAKARQMKGAFILDGAKPVSREML